jgi:hypothetical protein
MEHQPSKYDLSFFFRDCICGVELLGHHHTACAILKRLLCIWGDISEPCLHRRDAIKTVIWLLIVAGLDFFI